MNTINSRRVLWLMSDEDADTMLILARRHLQLVKEALDRNTTPERKMAINRDIERLRMKRQMIIDTYVGQADRLTII